MERQGYGPRKGVAPPGERSPGKPEAIVVTEVGARERRRGRFTWQALFFAWAAATLFSGLPSTVWALWTGSDPLEATWAAGAMLVPVTSGPRILFAAAVLVHLTVSLFWAVVFWLLLPRRRVLLWSVLGSAGVAIIDLGLIAPLLFPSIRGLAFGPQLADHLMWGACLGIVLQLHPHSRRR